MKIGLINPPLRPQALRNLVAENLFSNAMPLGLCYLAAVILNKGWEVKILDAAAERKTLDECVAWVKAQGCDLVGITSTTYNFAQAVALAQQLKAYGGTQLPLVLGGVHVTALTAPAMAHTCFDYGVIGEGEFTFLELLETLQRGGDLSQVKGLAYRQDDQVITTPYRELIEDLDVLPFPARQLLKTKLYASLPSDVRYLPKFTMVPTRGCPFHCIFCDSCVTGKKYRIFSPKYIVDEMEHLAKDFKVREIAFTTTTFTVDQKKSHEFLDDLLRRKLKLAWTVSTRVDTVTYDLLAKMKAAGCWAVRLGVESGDEEVLKFIRKGITLDQVRKVAQWCDDLKLHTKAFFIIGHLPDTRASILKSIDFACSLPIGDVTVQFNTPLPNTPQYQLAPQYGTLKQDFEYYSYWAPAFIPKSLTEAELVSFHKMFYRRFYLRWKVIWKHIKKITTYEALRNHIKTLKLFVYLSLKKGL